MFAVAEGKDPAAERKAERGRGTFEDQAAQYVEQHAKRKSKSWKQADPLVRKHLLPRWAKLQAADISRREVKAKEKRTSRMSANDPKRTFQIISKDHAELRQPARRRIFNEGGGVHHGNPAASICATSAHSPNVSCRGGRPWAKRQASFSLPKSVRGQVSIFAGPTAPSASACRQPGNTRHTFLHR
jgi:hypothetical protein